MSICVASKEWTKFGVDAESRVLVESGGKNEFHERDWYRGRSTRDYTRGKRGFYRNDETKNTGSTYWGCVIMAARRKNKSETLKFHVFINFLREQWPFSAQPPIWLRKWHFRNSKSNVKLFGKFSNHDILIFSNHPQSKFVHRHVQL